MARLNGQQSKTKTTEEGSNDNREPDLVPEYEGDDVETPPAPAAAADREEQEDRGEPPALPQIAKDSERDRIAARFRALRKQEIEEEIKAAPDDGDESGRSDEGDDDGDANAPEDKDTGSQDTDDETDLADAMELKVNGKVVKKSRDEVIALAQKAAAGEIKLEEAKSLFNEVKELAQALRGQKAPENQPEDDDEQTPQPTTSQAEAKPENQPAIDLDADKLDSIVERIQVGDTNEGKEALAELIMLVKDTVAPKPEQIRQVYQEDQNLAEIERERNEALLAFSNKYPEIANDPWLAQTGVTALGAEIIKDLKSVGVSDEDIRPIANDVKALSHAQRQLRKSGHKLRSYTELLNDVGSAMSEKYNIKPKKASDDPAQKRQAVDNSGQAQQRLERKRSATPQPRPAGMRTPSQQAPRPKTKREIINDQRRARGFAPLG